MEGSLSTTNLLLGIMAVVSVLEALLVIGVGVAGWMLYRRVMELVNGLEQRQIAPAMARVNAILDDVKGVTEKVKEETERVDQAIRTTMDRVDDTADRVRANVQAKTSRVVGFVRGMRAAIEGILHSRHQPPASRQRVESESHRRGKWQTDLIVSTRTRARHEGGGGSFVMGLLTGTVLGAGLGMLFAPKAGTELRSQLSEQAANLGNTASEGCSPRRRIGGQWAERGREMYNKASEAVAKGADEAQKYVRETASVRDRFERASTTAGPSGSVAVIGMRRSTGGSSTTERPVIDRSSSHLDGP